jgi:hypothetical protein
MNSQENIGVVLVRNGDGDPGTVPGVVVAGTRTPVLHPPRQRVRVAQDLHVL